MAAKRANQKSDVDQAIEDLEATSLLHIYPKAADQSVKTTFKTHA